MCKFGCFDVSPREIVSDLGGRHFLAGEATSNPILLVAEPRAIGKRAAQREASDKAMLLTLQM